MGQWVGSHQIIKNRVNCHLIEIIELCLKIYDLLTHFHIWICVWVGGWVDGWGGSVHLKSLKIEYIVDGWVMGGWLGGSVGRFMSNY